MFSSEPHPSTNSYTLIDVVDSIKISYTRARLGNDPEWSGEQSASATVAWVLHSPSECFQCVDGANISPGRILTSPLHLHRGNYRSRSHRSESGRADVRAMVRTTTPRRAPGRCPSSRRGQSSRYSKGQQAISEHHSGPTLAR